MVAFPAASQPGRSTSYHNYVTTHCGLQCQRTYDRLAPRIVFRIRIQADRDALHCRVSRHRAPVDLPGTVCAAVGVTATLCAVESLREILHRVERLCSCFGARVMGSICVARAVMGRVCKQQLCPQQYLDRLMAEGAEKGKQKAKSPVTHVGQY